MKRYDIITIFPKIFDSYFNESILKRGQKKKLLQIKVHDLRQRADDKHKTVDDKPYGGGVGMVFKAEPIFKAVTALKKSKILPHPTPPLIKGRGQGVKPRGGHAPFRGEELRRRVILFSAKGKLFTQADARRWAKYDQLILICGRYEGVDERVAKHIADEEISVGNFVLTGGEIPAMIVVDAVSRLVPGVLGKKESLKEESFGVAKRVRQQADELRVRRGASLRYSAYLEYPQYTRPENFRGWKVPEVLLSGNHKKIGEWRRKMSNF